ncbi:hypothetical protein [Vibrio breoganii]|uniref:hypothetical protein n=2 Tax=Vibrio breoganii TaxID=553239 RepID=UPI000C856874|nr:hypothetical protein [Vibrio breoganii]PMG91967.1 hypothetical protein BCU79_16260 [Vibrio breoganii]PMI21201.1 hypothetical protein BCU49_05275 [Vibrio breoganii]PMJ46942.1 hypothetical protein BCU21_08965 [Vibrio breoganii]PMK26884.1 hypothetical protein BCU03_02135 [Vibrio breoganii]PMK56047.1 hypothetical protein BCT97_12255 [Vibrio breoganii]
MKKSLSSLFAVIATSVSVSVTAEDYDSESLFSRNNAVMAVGAVDTINKYCVELGKMPAELFQELTLDMRENIERLSIQISGEEFAFSEEHEMYIEGISLGERLIRDAEQEGHVKQMCDLPESRQMIL